MVTFLGTFIRVRRRRWESERVGDFQCAIEVNAKEETRSIARRFTSVLDNFSHDLANIPGP